MIFHATRVPSPSRPSPREGEGKFIQNPAEISAVFSVNNLQAISYNLQPKLVLKTKERVFKTNDVRAGSERLPARVIINLNKAILEVIGG